MLSFAWPWVFLLLPLPMVVHIFMPPLQKTQAAIRVPFYQTLIDQKHTEIHLNHRKMHWHLWLLIPAWLLLVLACARPQWLGEPVPQQTSGRDLLIAVDISDSMDQTDMRWNDEPVTRLQTVKRILSEFIQRRQGDRLGLILFGTQAYLQAPLTFDRETVRTFLQEAQLGFAGPKTAIGDAIGLAVKRLEELDNSNPDQVVILLTDGANTAGEVKPLQAAQLAQQTGIKIYTIGIGANEMVVRGFFGQQRINPSAQLDEKTLVTIAQTTGGDYFRATNTDELNAIYEKLDILEPVIQDQQWLRPVKSLFIWPLSLALLLSIFITLNQLPTAINRSRYG